MEVPVELLVDVGLLLSLAEAVLVLEDDDVFVERALAVLDLLEVDDSVSTYDITAVLVAILLLVELLLEVALFVGNRLESDPPTPNNNNPIIHNRMIIYV